MPQFLVAIHHPAGFKSDSVDAATRADIDALNAEMKAKDIIRFVGGLQSETLAKSMWKHPDGRVRVTDGPYLETKEFIGGFWVLECPSIDEAVEWGQKAATACRTPVEVRPFH